MQTLTLLVPLALAAIVLLGWVWLRQSSKHAHRRPRLDTPAQPVVARSNASELAGNKMLSALRAEADNDTIVLPNPLRQRR
jgi:hypothetical protein